MKQTLWVTLLCMSKVFIFAYKSLVMLYVHMFCIGVNFKFLKLSLGFPFMWRFPFLNFNLNLAPFVEDWALPLCFVHVDAWKR